MIIIISILLSYTVHCISVYIYIYRGGEPREERQPADGGPGVVAEGDPQQSIIIMITIMIMIIIIKLLILILLIMIAIITNSDDVHTTTNTANT